MLVNILFVSAAIVFLIKWFVEDLADKNYFVAAFEGLLFVALLGLLWERSFS